MEKARVVREHANDSKLAALKKCLSEAEFEELKDGRGKLLLFTEHKDTLTYIRENLQKWGYTTCSIHGGMNPRDRKTTQELFRTQVQVCVATEAAGEGINLQFCHLMINYDIPWNPTRLEQRLGRIHRIGQERDVYAFNFVATESEDGQPIIEGKILQRLLHKLDLMKEALEGRVFDVIGEVLSLNEVNLPEMLREAAHDPRRLEEYIDQIDRIDPAKLKEYEQATGIALARAHVDFTGFQRQNLEIEEKRLMPCYVASHFMAAAEEVGLKVQPRADGLLRIEWVPADLRSDRLNCIKRVGKAESTYRKLTFQKQYLEQDIHLDAVLMGPGHPLYAAVDEKLNERLASLAGGVGFYIDPQTAAPYTLHFFEISIKGKNTKGKDETLYGELVAVREDAGQFEIVTCDVFVSLPEHRNPPDSIEPVKSQAAMDFLKTSYQLDRRADCQNERENYAAICRDYLEKSFTARINRTQERVMELMVREREKPEVKRARENMENKLDELKRSKEDRLSGLSKLSIARPGPVRHIASAIVLSPGADVTEQLAAFADEPDPITQRKSELAAEDMVIASLIAEGFPKENIERVGHLKIGFDIRAHRVVDEASGTIDVRRIEVKGRIAGQPIRLTTNEWYKAQQLGDTYWLCVVWNPLTDDPKHIQIQNPAVKLDHAKKEIVAARFFEFSAQSILSFKE